MNNLFKYATNVWLISVVSSPVLFCGLHVSSEDVLINPDTIVKLIGAGWVIGGVCSVPFWLLMYFIVQWISSFKKSMGITKALIQLCSILSIQGVFFLFDPHNKFGWNTFLINGIDELPFYYWCTSSLAIWFCQLKTRQEDTITSITT